MSLPRELFEHAEQPFAWGVMDCVQWAAASVEFYSGRKPALGYSYDSKREALRLIAEAGSLEALVTRELGEPKKPQDAEIGDVVLTAFVDGPMLGVADPPLVWLLHKDGFIPIDMEFAIKAWSCRKP